VALRPEQLDLISAFKASQTISGVIARDELLRTLLQVLLEQGGARRALVILARERELTVVAEATTDDADTRLEPSAVTAARAPVSILSYVQRTHERVLLDDVLADAGRFADDAYLVRACPRSLLCLPVRRQAAVVALLYLENDLAPGAFTPERLMTLELLATQAAISLENALFVESQRANCKQAEAAALRAQLLGEATALISSTFDYEGVFHQLTRLCVRWFADWAIIDLMEGESSVRLGGAHRDPEKEALLRELSERYPAGVGSNTPAATVFRTGAPLHLVDISDAERRSCALDDRHSEILRQLGTRSSVVVPLITRDIRFGALTLGAGLPRHFAEADVELAAEIGRRVALAIDNARLLRETQRAVRLRDEFLSIASHELRTPITSLMLDTDFLLHASATRGGGVARERADRSLDRVRRKTERLCQLVNELLDVTRIEEGRLELTTSEVDLANLVRAAVGRFEVELATAGCSLSFDCRAPVVGRWDAARLEQVVTNLLSNAIKFGSGRPIEVAVRARNGTAVLEVRDHGIGIEPARLPFVFDRFERAVSSRHYGGLGLGLYIARWVVHAHGGTIRAMSSPGHGSTFTVEIPSVMPVAAADRASVA
jgi:signal transduction histidine kinase